jgi:hypothetical protein
MRRAGVEEDPLSHCRTIQEFNSALSQLSDAQLRHVWEGTHRERASGLSDEALLTELDEARREEQEQDNNNGPTIVVG